MTLLAAGHGWGLALFPLLAAAIAAVFAVFLAGRFVRRRRPYEGVWALAMAMFAAGSFAMFLGVVRGWEPTDYRVYWLFGAIVNVPFLFQGEAYLLVRRRVWAHALLAVQMAVSGFAGYEVWHARLVTGALANVLPLGKDVFRLDPLPYRLAQYYALPAYFLLLFALVWSARQMRGKPELRNRTSGVLWIAGGATVVAIGSGIGAARHLVPLFSVGLAAGIAVMFWGFLQTTRVPSSGARLPQLPPGREGPTSTVEVIRPPSD